jgi:hypothetical protein
MQPQNGLLAGFFGWLDGVVEEINPRDFVMQVVENWHC